MLKDIVLFVCVCLFWNVIALNVTPELKIAGGKDANITDYPYTLSVMINGSHSFGAVLINTSWALTSAYWAEDLSLDEGSVRAGSSYRSSGGQIVNISEILIHPMFDFLTMDYDLALLRLSENITHSDADIIELVEAGSSPFETTISTSLGWGKTWNTDGTPFSEVLQRVNMPILNLIECNYFYEWMLNDRNICAGNLEDGGVGVCLGDFGGPLVVNDRLAGISSWNFYCGEEHSAGIFTDVGNPDLRNWITNVTGI